MQREAVPFLKSRVATVYFQDIRGFTTLAEIHEPDVLAAIMEEYMEVMTTAITDVSSDDRYAHHLITA